MTLLIDVLYPAVGALLAMALLAATAWISYLGARQLLPRAPVSARLSGGAVCAFWLLAALFQVLAPMSLFRLWVLLPTLGVLAALGHRFLDGRAGIAALRDDLAATKRRLRSFAWTPAGGLLAATGLVGLVRTLRGTAAPPLGWDALTYHLFKAGRWVQSHGLAPHEAPDAWGNYEYFPLVGDLYWAWAMVPFGSDLAITAAGAAIWAVIGLATYACAVTLRASPPRAAMAAAAVLAMPATVAYLSSAYVDNTTLALFLLGSLFVARLAIERRPAEALLAVAAFALMVGVKLTTAGLFALAAVVIVGCVVRSEAPWRTRRLVLLACLAVAAVGVPSYLRAWIEQGSPFFPFRIDLGGFVLSQGSADAGWVSKLFMSAERYRLSGPWEFWQYFLWRQVAGGSFVNPGPGVVVFALLAALALPTFWRDRRTRIASGFFLLTALLMLGGFYAAGGMELFRKTIKVSTAGRYLTPAFGALAVLAARWGGRYGAYLWGAAGGLGLWFALPRGWVRADLEATGWVALTVAVVGLATALVVRRGARRGFRRCRGWGARALAIVVLWALGVAAIAQVRAAYRYPIWQAANDPVAASFHMHRLSPVYASAWPVWEAFDEPDGHRLAVTAGWDGIGHNWYQYPLLGSRLQNRVFYVPVTANGEVVDYRDPEEVARRADFAAWLARLVTEDVDHVVSLAPRWTIEDFWLRSHPEIFLPRVSVHGNFHAAFRIDRDGALAALRSSGAGAALTTRTRSTAPPAPRAPD